MNRTLLLTISIALVTNIAVMGQPPGAGQTVRVSPGVIPRPVDDIPHPPWFPQPGFDEGDDPEVIRHAPADLQQMWSDIQEELKKLDAAAGPVEERAALLVQRGRLLLAVHSRARAFLDFQDATKALVAAASTEDAPDDVAIRFQSLISQHSGPEPLPSASASGLLRSYGAGYYAFRDGHYKRAIEYFDQAIAAAPAEPTYYYYRALACRQLGLDEQADEDARSGAFLEFQSIRARWPDATTEHSYYVSLQLSRVQGRSRVWLEKYRAVRRSNQGTAPQQAISRFGNRDMMAKVAYGLGSQNFWKGNYEQAVECLDLAIQIAPHEPIYFYYRALARRKLGQDKSAGEDAQKGAFLEFAVSGAEGPNAEKEQTYNVAQQLTRVQGEWRMWLEGFRSGTTNKVAIRGRSSEGRH